MAPSGSARFAITSVVPAQEQRPARSERPLYIPILPSSVATPPAYAVELVQGRSRDVALSWSGEGRLISGRSFSLISLAVRDCLLMTSERFEQAVTTVYQDLGHLLSTERRYPVRLWNFVPSIHDRVAPQLDRYMVFNAGRHAGYSAWSHGELADWLPAATAVGAGQTLAVHCLAADAPGSPIENPRQIPAYRYSRRYGPRPPCFARATIVRDGESPLLLVSGTASIKGENSLHIGNLAAQLEETFDNLRHLWDAARARDHKLAGLTDARIYLPVPSARRFIVDRLAAAFPSMTRVEVLPAALCRRELLVEIEAASIPVSALRLPLRTVNN